MANRLIGPNLQFCDQNGLPYAGGTLSFFASGTSTPLSTFSDQALSIANPNPVVLDSAGRAGNVFLQNLAYKVTLADVNSNIIWTVDPVYASDFSTLAQVQSTNGSPNGQLAGTAGSAGIPASMAWDFVNNILYVCTQTGNAAGAVWTAINAATAAAVIPPPQGYLTPTSATPIIASDAISATSIFYTPFVGNIVPIFNGASFVPTTFAELTLALASQHAANNIYDVFVFNNSGVVTIGTGPAWNNSGAGTGSRGSGAGTTQLNRINGILVNAVQMTARNGSTTFTVNAGLGTYVGSIFIDSAAGQATFHRSFGQSRKWAAWNAYNQQPILLQAGDNTASWSYGSTWRPSNNASANSLTLFTGFQAPLVNLAFNQRLQATGANVPNGGTSSSLPQIGIGLNSTTSPSGKLGTSFVQFTWGTVNGAAQQNISGSDGLASFPTSPAIGIHTITALEQDTSGNAPTFFGTQSHMQLSAQWFG